VQPQLLAIAKLCDWPVGGSRAYQLATSMELTLLQAYFPEGK